MPYWEEFRTGWRLLLATAIGMGSGVGALGVITSIMASHFMRDLGWSPASFAKVGTISIILGVFIPIAGRMADTWGVRRTAAIGVVALPVSMVALSQMTGNIRDYYLIYTLQAALCVTTSATVYARAIVAHFHHARGLALAVAASAPGLTGIIAGYILNPFVDVHGWREGYQVTAVAVFICGCLALSLLPAQREIAPALLADTTTTSELPAVRHRRSWTDYPIILRTPAFWLLIAVMLLCNLYQPLVLSQINLLIRAHGLDGLEVGKIISAFSFAMIIGRFTCGAAIDRLPAQIVAAVGMAMPAVGLFLLSWHNEGAGRVMVALIFIGLAVGAEGDLIGVLVARAFGVAIFGSVMGLVTAAISVATASGAFILGMMLQKYGNYDQYLVLTGTTTIMGSLLLLLLPRAAAVASDPISGGEPQEPGYRTEARRR